VKTTGDGLLAEFPSAVDAIVCAAEIQRGMAAREAGVATDRLIIFRIGINVGDIVFEDGDIYGDGVNVAARIEPLADSGGICISHTVFTAVRNKVELGFEDVGAQSLKNISEPVQVYRVLLDPEAAGKVVSGRLKRSAPIWRQPAYIAAAAVVVILGGGLALRDVLFVLPSDAARQTRSDALEQLGETEDPRRIAVLYMESGSPQEEVPFLASGLTEALINELSAVPALHVMSRNAVAPFRDEIVAPDSIGRALGVGTLVHGTVALSEDQVRVSVSFVNTSTGQQFASTQVLGTRAGLFDLQEELAHEVAVYLREMLGEEVALIERQAGAENVEAWQLLQRARAMSDQADALSGAGDMDSAWERLGAADTLLAEAEEVAPGWVEPTVRRGWLAYQRSRWSGSSGQAEAGRWIEEGMVHAQVALQLDSLNADGLELRGTLQYWKWLLDLEPDANRAEQLFDDAEANLRGAIAVNPSQAGAWAALSHLVLNKGAAAEGKMAASRAYEADAYLRNADLILWRLFSISYDLEDRVEAERWCGELGRRFPSDARFAECQLWLMTMHDAEIDLDQAWELATEYEELSPSQTVDFRRRWARMAVAAALARAGQPDSARVVAERSRGGAAIDPARDLVYLEAFVRTILGDNDEAMNLLAEYLAVVGEDAGEQLDHWWFDGLRAEPWYPALREGCGGGG
jgi:TolB-like protein